MVLAHLPYSPKAHGTQLKKEGERQSNPIEIQAEDREQGKKMEADSAQQKSSTFRNKFPFAFLMIIIWITFF